MKTAMTITTTAVGEIRKMNPKNRHFFLLMLNRRYYYCSLVGYSRVDELHGTMAHCFGFR